MAKDVLLTWVGERDARNRDPRTGTDRDGPILTLLAHRRFDEMYLLYTTDDKVGNFAKRASDVLVACRERHSHMVVHYRPVEQFLLVTDYEQLFHVTNNIWSEIRDEHRAEDVAYHVCISPGTPQMQMTWILLVQAGRLPARMYQVLDPTRAARIPRFDDADGMTSLPVVRELNLSIPNYPQIVDPGETVRIVAELNAENRTLHAEVQRQRAETAMLQSGGAVGEIELPVDLDRRLDEIAGTYYATAFEQALDVAPREQEVVNEVARMLNKKPPTVRFQLDRRNLKIRVPRTPRNLT